jgi:transcriptional regulator with AAA-type ATPase domain/tetratricopeptide (TPR) repeat protein
MDPFAGLIGDSPGMVALREQVVRLLSRLARMPRWPALLVLGETGVGKGHLVRALHQAGPRRRGPFVDVNCAAIPETLLEAELFGFVRGAFTDARYDKPGLCQAATGGVLFLDEIGALPFPLQAKILKALDERQVRRLGSTRQEPFDAWIVSATGEDLTRLVAERRFRPDLYHRLSAVTVRIPPLRERDGDIVLLSEHFLARIASEHGIEPRRLADDARAALNSYAWPGNVRELANRMERVALLGDDSLITALALDLPRLPEAKRPACRQPVAPLERAQVLAALGEAAWNISRAAARLEVPRNTLRYRIRKFGLVQESAADGHGGSRGALVARVGSRSPLRWEHRSVALLRAALAPAPGEPPSRLAPTIERLIEQVSIRGGRIEEITPSSIVAAFGPEGIEDGPRRAVQAALAMHQAVPPPSAVEGHAPVSVGIHVAPCLVALGRDPMGMAPADRTAAWITLEALTDRAGPLGIALSEAAARLIERRFTLRRVEDKAGSGGTAYHLVRPESTRTDTTPQGLSPFVGRARELSVLQGLVERAAAGQGQVVGLVGEPGVGKSRLLHELRAQVGGAGGEWLQGHCMSYGGSTPYLPVLDLLWERCGVARTESPRAILDSVSSALAKTGPGAAEGLPYLAALLGLDPGASWPGGLSAETLKVRTFEVLERVLAETERDRVVVIAVEDVHWRDPTSEEFFTTLAESLAARRVLFVSTYRPGSHPPWLDRSYASQVALPPLDREASVALARAALGAERSDETLVGAIVGRAEGNPFFIEELAVAARRDALSAANAVPATVQAVLRARVDRLRPRERAVLQALAAVGRQAPTSLIAVATALEEDAVLAAFRNLHAAELLVQERPGREALRRLRHALTRDVAYLSLPPDECRELHGRIVTAIETLHAGRLETEVERLADHATRAEMWDKAVAYCWAAGRQSASRSAHREAVTWLERALSALAHRPQGQDAHEAAIDLRLALHDSFIALNEKERSLAELCRAETLATALHDEPRLARTLSGLVVTLHLKGAFTQAIETGRRALAIAAVRREPWLGVSAGFHVGQAYAMVGDHRRAIRHFEESTRAAGEGGRPLPSAGRLQPHLTDRARMLGSIDSRAYLAISLAELGEFAAALVTGKSALALAEDVKDPIPLLATWRGLGYVHLRRGRRPCHLHARASPGGHPHAADSPVLHRNGRLPRRRADARGPGRGSRPAPHRGPGSRTGKPGPHARLTWRSRARSRPDGGGASRGGGGARLRPSGGAARLRGLRTPAPRGGGSPVGAPSRGKRHRPVPEGRRPRGSARHATAGRAWPSRPGAPRHPRPNRAPPRGRPAVPRDGHAALA